MDSELNQQLEDLVQTFFSDAGLELFDFKVNRHKRNVFIQILVDRPCGGITIEQCAQLNRMLHQHIDAGGLLPVPYSLELSSPGADRLLQTKKDFLRVISHEVRFILCPGDHLKGEVVGVIKQVNDQEVIIISTGQEEVRIQFEMIKKAYQNI